MGKMCFSRLIRVLWIEAAGDVHELYSVNISRQKNDHFVSTNNLSLEHNL